VQEKDRRKHARRAVRYKAWIDIRDSGMIDCQLVDISEGGAKVEVSDPIIVPDRFVLLFSRQGSPQRPCKVVWRHDRHIGVQFAAIPTSESINSVFEL
jgi:hypothetical protein